VTSDQWLENEIEQMKTKGCGSSPAGHAEWRTEHSAAEDREMSKAKTKCLVVGGQWLVEDKSTADSCPAPSPTTNHQSPTTSSRRGVLLLVVLSLLVLFSLVAVTFVLVAGRYYDAARNQIKVEQTGDNPKQLLDEVLAQCIRDTDNPNSVLRGHSLLDDLYGNDGIKYSNNGTALTITQTATSQLLDIRFTPTAAPAPALVAPTPAQNWICYASFPNTPVWRTPQANVPLSLILSEQRLQMPGFFNGCILTAVDGAAKGKSTRVMGWTYVVPPAPTPPYYAIRIAAFADLPWAQLSANFPTAFIINGRPFNGTGFGLNPFGNPNADATLLSSAQVFPTPSGATVTAPYALLPNPVYFDGQSGKAAGVTTVTPPAPNSYYPHFGGIGGADEDYDAPDPQNMLLAYIPLNAGSGGANAPLIPSLYRAETMTWLDQKNGTALTGAPQHSRLIDRQKQLRPIPQDHPLFPRRLPNDPFDVDNDGDGVAESIWVDAGLPVRTGADGRAYKPMVAVLCVDLDGRLNVNAHGSVVHLNSTFATPIAAGTGSNATLSTFLYTTNGVAASATLPRGLGFGPAEINLAGLFPTPADYKYLFQGGTLGGVKYEGRYGESDYAASNIYATAMPGYSQAATGPDDQLVKIKRYGMPNYYFAMPSQYGSPGDVWGRMAIGLDYSGHPIYSYLTAGGRAELIASNAGGANLPDSEFPNDPYSINLGRARGVQNTPTKNDNLFSVTELERVLRLYDNDSINLPDRLRAILNPTGASTIEVSKLITTDSYDLAVPAAPLPRNIAVTLKTQNGNGHPGPASFLDIVKAKLVAAGSTSVNNDLAALITKGVIAPELLAGQRFDVNRPFGNGRDDDNDGIVDEPDEYSKVNEVPITWGGITGFTKPPFMDLNHDGNTTADPQEGYKARVAYARQLYFLMLLFSDLEFPWANDGGAALSGAQLREVTTRRIAQWAINVVDFRDADSIMTAFEYDANPFNGWEVDGDASTVETTGDRRVVWGVERPELLITESLAFHDRRVADLATDSNGSMHSMSSAPPDSNYDQVRVPQGSLFLELYSPHSPKTGQGVYPSDLYQSGKLDLGKVAPADAGGVRRPVWRIAIAAVDLNNKLLTRLALSDHGDTANFDPIADPVGSSIHTSLFDPSSSGGAVPIERLIWFANLDATTHPDSSAASVYWNRNTNPPLLSPGRFAVVGPRPVTVVGRNNGGGLASQQISLNVTAPGSVQFTSTTGVGSSQTALPIICDANITGWANPIGMNISEPKLATYYTSVPNATGDYSPPLDTPLDLSNATLTTGITLSTGTTLAFRTALLQRLADPTRAYDQNSNPYITVDWHNIDLTVFNGEVRATGNNDPSDSIGNQSPFAFSTRERGSTTAPTAPRDIWNPMNQPAAPTASPKGTQAVFDFNLVQTLGALNTTFGPAWSPTGDLADYVNMPNPTNGPTYPWLTWNNRPFISAAELLLVPPTAAEQTLRKFTVPTAPSTATNGPYQTSQAAYHLPFDHLLNFRQGGTGAAGNGPSYARVLDYLSVPTPYIGDESYINLTAPLPAANGAPSFMAPFNVISNRREPGRVNINTMPGFANAFANPVWEGVRDSLGVPAPSPEWKEIIASLRGEATMTANLTNPTASSSYFARPFRSAAGSAYALPGTVAAPINEIESTFLRQSVANPGRGLFENRPTVATPYADPVRNAYFHHQPIQRLNNLLTTRSNVYAIWLTVGYFEVRPAASSGPGTPYPDGYELMQEMGSDTGEVVRHRAFYIYDRSIPVGFERGKDHNFADGLLLKRFIE
jgi:hypothetical protein